MTFYAKIVVLLIFVNTCSRTHKKNSQKHAF